MTEIQKQEWFNIPSSLKLSKYQITRCGQLKNRETGYIFKINADKHGYVSYPIRMDNGNKFSYRAHILVAKVFIPNPESKPTVDHINRIRNDNRVENLRWATYIEQGTNKNKPLKKRGRPIYQLSPDGEILRKWDRIKDAAEEYSINRNTLGSYCGIKVQYIGYLWEYVDQIESNLPNEEWRPIVEYNNIYMYLH